MHFKIFLCKCIFCTFLQNTFEKYIKVNNILHLTNKPTPDTPGLKKYINLVDFSYSFLIRQASCLPSSIRIIILLLKGGQIQLRQNHLCCQAKQIIHRTQQQADRQRHSKRERDRERTLFFVSSHQVLLIMQQLSQKTMPTPHGPFLTEHCDEG